MTDATAPLIVLATGGTGGHVFPAEALAVELASRDFRLALVTDRRGGAFSGLLGDLETYRIRAGGIAGKRFLPLVKSSSELAIGLFQAFRILNRLRPAVVVGFGGYASVPTMLAAGFNGSTTAIHEQNAVFGRANRLLASRARRIATCFDIVEGLDPRNANKVVRTGMPVRPAVLSMHQRPYPPLTDVGPVELLVIGGSQGARVLSDVVPAAIAKLDEALRKRLNITQQCRPEDLDRVGAVYREISVAAELNSFFADVPERLASCHLLIGRSGAATIAEITAVGRPSILVPYPHATDNHQDRNAYAVDAAGAGWLIPESAFTSAGLAARLDSLIGLPAILNRAAASAKSVGRPDATSALADMVCGLIDSPERIAA